MKLRKNDAWIYVYEKRTRRREDSKLVAGSSSIIFQPDRSSKDGRLVARPLRGDSHAAFILKSQPFVESRVSTIRGLPRLVKTQKRSRRFNVLESKLRLQRLAKRKKLEKYQLFTLREAFSII